MWLPLPRQEELWEPSSLLKIIIITDDTSVNQGRVKDISITKETGAFLLISKEGVYVDTRGRLEGGNDTGKGLWPPCPWPSPIQPPQRRKGEVAWFSLSPTLPYKAWASQTLPFWPDLGQRKGIGLPGKFPAAIMVIPPQWMCMPGSRSTVLTECHCFLLTSTFCQSRVF